MTQDRTHALVLALGLSLITASYLPNVVADPDLWGHTKFGIDHIQSGHLAKTDPFSYTAAGREWVNHEWLAELLFGAAYLSGGSRGLVLLRSLIFCGLVGGLFWLYWSRWRNAIFIILLGVYSIPLLSVFTNIRPHSFTYLLVVIFLLCIDAYTRGRKRWIYLFPPMMAVWVNLHGGFVVGIALASVGLASLGFAREGTMPVPTLEDKRRLALIWVLTVGATLLNPYGVKLYSYLTMALTLPREHITEWMTLKDLQLVPYSLLVIVPTSLMIVTRAGQRLTHVVFYLMTTVVAFFNARFLILLAIFGTLVLLDGASAIWNDWAGRRQLRVLSSLSSAFAVGALILAVAAPSVVRGVRDFTRYGAQVRVDPAHYPVGATDFLKRHALGPNLALPFHWGEYAIWHLSPRYKVSQDGRYETVYPVRYVDSLLEAYYTGDLEGFVRGQNVDVLLLESKQELDVLARQSHDWIEMYRDPTAVVYVPRAKVPGSPVTNTMIAASQRPPSPTATFFP